MAGCRIGFYSYKSCRAVLTANLDREKHCFAFIVAMVFGFVVNDDCELLEIVVVMLKLINDRLKGERF